MPSPELAALRILSRRIGLGGAVATLLRVGLGHARGEPFADLPPAEDRRERASRSQAGGAVLLHRALARRLPAAEALELTAEVVEGAALAFLGSVVGGLSREDLVALDDEGRRAFLAERLDAFPNATARIDAVSADHVAFTITRCRLVELVRAVDQPDLAPLFCAADARFFGEVNPDVRLSRDTTLAEGGPHCPFVIALAPEAS